LRGAGARGSRIGSLSEVTGRCIAPAIAGTIVGENAEGIAAADL
jgi:hypothetical protein